MKIFISWSGKKSRAVAAELQTWLKSVIQSVDVFMSDEIGAGTPWLHEIAKELDGSSFGIVCVTRSNRSAPWLNFEAGALAKNLEVSRLVPIPIDLEMTDIPLPIGQFNGKELSQHGMRELVRLINEEAGSILEPEILASVFDQWWPNLESKLEAIMSDPELFEEPGNSRDERDLLEEVLTTVRQMARDDRGIGEKNGDAIDGLISHVFARLSRSGTPATSATYAGKSLVFYVDTLPSKTHVEEMTVLAEDFGADLKFERNSNLDLFKADTSDE